MEINTQILEKAKELLKNVKEVRCLADEKIYNIVNVKSFYYSPVGVWVDVYISNKNEVMDVLIYDYEKNKWAEFISYKEEIDFIDGKETKTPTHYDNSKGSIYQFCENQKLNSYEFDIIKRVVRSRKKGNFKEDLEKTKVLIDLYLKEYEN